MLSPHRLADTVFRSVRDNDRVQFSKDLEVNTHTTLAVADTQTLYAHALGHVAAITASLDTAAVDDTDIRITVNGRDLGTVTIPTGELVSNRLEPDRLGYTAGEPIASVIDAVDAGQTGTLTVSLETEPRSLVPRDVVRPATARERLKRSTTQATLERGSTALLRPRNTLSEENGNVRPPEAIPEGDQPDPIPPRYRGIELPPRRGPRT